MHKLRRKFAAASLPRLFGNKVPGHTTRAPPVGFKMATNDIQFYAIANLDMTSLLRLITAVERLKAAALACVICSLVHVGQVYFCYNTSQNVTDTTAKV